MFENNKRIGDLEDFLFKLFKNNFYYYEEEFKQKLFEKIKENPIFFSEIIRNDLNMNHIHQFLTENEYIVNQPGKPFSIIVKLKSKKIIRRIKLNQIS